MEWNIENVLPYLDQTVGSTNFELPGYTRHEGKVRDSYAGNKQRILIASDRLSCFDKVVTTVPFKGQVLTQLALHWFDKTSDIIKNHIIEALSADTLLVQEAKVVPIEVVVRGYLTGSAWRDYQAGKTISGVSLPAGLIEYQKFDTPLMTPSTKAELGSHDEPISEQEILERNIVPAMLWEEIEDKAFALFERASNQVAARGLLLVDTKFEFGLLDGKLILVDEIFTLDSSRYWEKDSYVPGKKPKMLDKEPVRQWLLEQHWQGDGPAPHFTDEYRAQLTLHYVESFKKITGQEFKADLEPSIGRISSAIKRLM